jgi:pimeloyl-ACP methyl ester carboxylesterase
MGRLTKPKSYDRFFLQAQAVRTHDAWDRLPRITAPTLVMGGEQDNCLGPEASRELAARIPGAELKMYEQWGHGLYEEAEDFQETVLAFLNR